MDIATRTVNAWQNPFWYATTLPHACYSCLKEPYWHLIYGNVHVLDSHGEIHTEKFTLIVYIMSPQLTRAKSSRI